MRGLCYVGLEVIPCYSFSSQWRGDCDVWVIRLVKNAFGLQNILSVFFFKKGLCFQDQDFWKTYWDSRDQQPCGCYVFFFPGNFRYYWLSGFVPLMGGWKILSRQWSFQCKESMTFVSKCCLPTDEFQMKSNSTKLLFPLKAFCLLVFLENSVLRPAAFLWCICSLLY